METSPYFIGNREGFTPQIARLIGMMNLVITSRICGSSEKKPLRNLQNAMTLGLKNRFLFGEQQVIGTLLGFMSLKMKSITVGKCV
jgi:hypothetical protein